MKASPFASLGKSDFLKSIIVAVLAAFLTALSPILDSGALPTMEHLKGAGIAGLAAGVGYLLKNFLTNSNDQFLKREG